MLTRFQRIMISIIGMLSCIHYVRNDKNDKNEEISGFREALRDLECLSSRYGWSYYWTDDNRGYYWYTAANEIRALFFAYGCDPDCGMEDDEVWKHTQYELGILERFSVWLVSLGYGLPVMYESDPSKSLPSGTFLKETEGEWVANWYDILERLISLLANNKPTIGTLPQQSSLGVIHCRLYHRSSMGAFPMQESA